jgi:hypothetical protein
MVVIPAPNDAPLSKLTLSGRSRATLSLPSTCSAKAPVESLSVFAIHQQLSYSFLIERTRNLHPCVNPATRSPTLNALFTSDPISSTYPA